MDVSLFYLHPIVLESRLRAPVTALRHRARAKSVDGFRYPNLEGHIVYVNAGQTVVATINSKLYLVTLISNLRMLLLWFFIFGVNVDRIPEELRAVVTKPFFNFLIFFFFFFFSKFPQRFAEACHIQADSVTTTVVAATAAQTFTKTFFSKGSGLSPPEDPQIYKRLLLVLNK